METQTNTPDTTTTVLLSQTVQDKVPESVYYAVEQLVKEQVDKLVTDAMKTIRPELEKTIATGVGPQLFELVRNSILSSVQNANARITTTEPKVRKKAKAQKQVKAAKPTVKTKTITPTRGRFQVMNIKSINVPVKDTDGKLYVNCKYSDGVDRTYSADTIMKNKDVLTQILGESSVRKVIDKIA